MLTLSRSRVEGWAPHSYQTPRSALLASATLLLLFVLTAFTTPTSARVPSATLVIVRDEANALVAGAAIYLNCALQGTTNAQGRFTLPNASAGDVLFVYKQIYQGSTSKPNHNGWAYRVYQTNIVQNNDGSQQGYTITNPATTQVVIISPQNIQIGFNLVASVEYNATPANLQDIAAGLTNASRYLFDVTDGQMYFQQVTIYEDKQNWTGADLKYFATMWPKASPVGRYGMTDLGTDIYLPGPGFEGPWVQPNGYRTIIHEFSHYAIGVFDEYQKFSEVFGIRPAQCTLDRYSQPSEVRASIMSDQRDATEFCNDSNHNPDTVQGQLLGQSVWATLFDGWGLGTDWVLQTPMSRGTVDPGPFTLPCNWAIITPVPAPVTSCAPLPVQVTQDGTPVAAAAGITLLHNGARINEGFTDGLGRLTVYGAVPGDSLSVYNRYYLHDPVSWYSVAVPITTCGAINIAVTAAPGPFYALRPELHWSANQLNTIVHVETDPPPQLILIAEQDGANRQAVPLNYDPGSRNYSGVYPFSPTLALNFHLEVEAHNAQQGVAHTAYHFSGVQYHQSGLPGQFNAAAPLTSTAWELLPNDGFVGLTVDANSLADGAGLLVGETTAPAAAPPGLVAVGGPYSVQGEQLITGTVYLTIPYRDQPFCGLQTNTIGLYRYDGAGWTLLPTGLNTDHTQAHAQITEYGTYAVFAAPNAPISFSDVPPTYSFYTYIQDMACRGIVAGYPDGTFRPGNNATRSQFTKMITLAYRWPQELPATPTFADVPFSNTFAVFVETAYRMGVIAGYPCGGPAEPCDPTQHPYFRPGANITRGQIAKIVVLGGQWPVDTSGGPHFADVPTGAIFYDYVETSYNRGIISGYPCGGPFEPCIAPDNRPYFRPGANATRGQISKMIDLGLAPR